MKLTEFTYVFLHCRNTTDLITFKPLNKVPTPHLLTGVAAKPEQAKQNTNKT